MSAGEEARRDRARRARIAAATPLRREWLMLGLSVALCVALLSGLIG